MRQTRKGVCTTVEHRGEHKNEDTAGYTRDVVVHQKQRKVIRTKKNWWVKKRLGCFIGSDGESKRIKRKEIITPPPHVTPIVLMYSHTISTQQFGDSVLLVLCQA